MAPRASYAVEERHAVSMAARGQSLKTKDSMVVINEILQLRLIRAEAPHIAVTKVGKPDGPMRDAN
jgi:hypothetical protein